MNSELLQSVRKKIQDGEWHELCSGCLQTEESGSKSPRQYSIEDFKAEEMGSKVFQELEVTNEDITYVDIRMGNICNYACRMCDPSSSQKVRRLWSKMPKDSWYFEESEIDRDYRWPEMSNHWKELIESFPNLNHLYMAGGEPLLLKETYELLEHLVDLGISQNVGISINTNVSVSPKKLEELIPKFRHWNFICSLDGVGSTQEKIRHGSVWEETKQCLKSMGELLNTYANIEAGVVTTVQADNIFDLENLLDELKELNQEFPKFYEIPMFNPVVGMPELCISSLYPEEKVRARETLQVLKEKFRGEQNLCDQLQVLLNILDKEPTIESKGRLKNFRDLVDQAQRL